MTPNLSAMQAEIAIIQARLNTLQTRYDNASAIYASALAQKPAGIPASWLPDFLVSAGTASVKAWFDPSHYGNSLNPQKD